MLWWWADGWITQLWGEEADSCLAWSIASWLAAQWRGWRYRFFLSLSFTLSFSSLSSFISTFSHTQGKVNRIFCLPVLTYFPLSSSLLCLKPSTARLLLDSQPTHVKSYNRPGFNLLHSVQIGCRTTVYPLALSYSGTWNLEPGSCGSIHFSCRLNSPSDPAVPVCACV